MFDEGNFSCRVINGKSRLENKDWRAALGFYSNEFSGTLSPSIVLEGKRDIEDSSLLSF